MNKETARAKAREIGKTCAEGWGYGERLSIVDQAAKDRALIDAIAQAIADATPSLVPSGWLVAPDCEWENCGLDSIGYRAKLDASGWVPVCTKHYKEQRDPEYAAKFLTESHIRRLTPSLTPEEEKEVEEIEARLSKVPEGPYFVTFDAAEECGPHANSGLAKVDTGRNAEWPIARLCEWPTAEFIKSAREDIPRLIELLRSTKEQKHEG